MPIRESFIHRYGLLLLFSNESQQFGQTEVYVSPVENGVYASNINLMTRRSVTEDGEGRLQLYKIDWLSRFCRRLDENK